MIERLLDWLARRNDDSIAECPRISIVADVEAFAAACARFSVRERWPYGPILWGDWTWSELPMPSSQFWPASAARRA